MSVNELPVVVIGAGPIGLAAAAQSVSRGPATVVLEAGPSAGTSVREWLFSRWAELVDPAAEKLLAPTGWQAPAPETYPTGAEWAQRYLQAPRAPAPLIDPEAADRVELTLPETGVCGGAGLIDTPTDEAGGCCGPTESVPASVGARSGDAA